MLLTKRASGDEEISATGLDVQGVLLCQSLPHLSHLGEMQWCYLGLHGKLCYAQPCKHAYLNKEWLVCCHSP